MAATRKPSSFGDVRHAASGSKRDFCVATNAFATVSPTGDASLAAHASRCEGLVGFLHVALDRDALVARSQQAALIATLLRERGGLAGIPRALQEEFRGGDRVRRARHDLGGEALGCREWIVGNVGDQSK